VQLIVAGRTILLSRAGMGEHLWLVLTDPDPTTQKVIMVALVTERAHTDKTVRLDIGDHRFVRHPSNIDFGTATFAPSAALLAGVSSGAAALHEDLKASILRLVREGLLTSSRTPNAVKEHCAPLFGVK
jgi:hypothetical protein